ncbi:hypothetical protein SynROS8604_01690 [Synechococcus sp. ROS8604]|nr:hypothetical protein SynROS8604_01690 [Synechococcus sp. ROS8604]
MPKCSDYAISLGLKMRFQSKSWKVWLVVDSTGSLEVR